MRHAVVIHGIPTPKGRPRVVVIDGKARGLTPKKTRTAIEDIKLQLYLNRPKKLLEGALAVRIAYTLIKPKSARRVYPTVKPDLDNLDKMYLDCMNKIYYKDDSQICDKVVTKRYGNVDQTIIELITLSDERPFSLTIPI